MKKIMMAVAAIACVVPGATGQNEIQGSYQEFRQGILNDYQEFRNTILSHYADFLEGTWHEYEAMEPLKKDNKPKPKKVPEVKLNKPSAKPVDMPAPIADAKPKLSTPVKPEMKKPEPQPSAKPSSTPSLLDKPKVEVPPEAGALVAPSLKLRPNIGEPVLARFKNPPAPIPEPDRGKMDLSGDEGKVKTGVSIPSDARLADRGNVPAIPKYDGAYAPEEEESREGMDVVDFYGMEILVPKIDFKISQSLGKVSDLARHWRILEEQDLADKVEESIMPKIKKLGLNDYLTYEFLCAYMDSKFPGAGLSPKMSAVHYMLANLGFDARIAVVANTGDPLILMPSKQTLYAKVYMPIDGQNYYVFSPNNANLQGAQIATCTLPKVAKSGKKMDFRINGLNLPMKERHFEVKHGDMTLNGVLNENLMPIVYRYPQMDTEDFAVSVLDKRMRADLVAQVKEQLGGKEKLAATNELLKFTQSGFQYATDGDFHGFEKPYFLEENFYYPRNDCEDRAIFYTYMLWNALGVENQLLAFPGHESASVSIPDVKVKGTGYEYNGKHYWISDPTFIGSVTGMCMPDFERTAPTVDHTYPK